MDPVIQTGMPAPQFQLFDLQGNLISLDELQGRIVILNFWSAECIWSERVDQELLSYLNSWKARVKVLWIASNINETRDLIVKVAKKRQIPLVLLDDHLKVVDLYGAQTTPHFFVVDDQGRLAYQGAWDDITFRQRVATQVYVPKAVEALIDHKSPEITQTPPYGCALVRFTV